MICNRFLTVGLCIFFVIVNVVLAQNAIDGSACQLLDGSLGVCKPAILCKWLEDEITSGRMSVRDISKLRCSFVGNVEVTCCGDVVTKRKSELACDLYRRERRPVFVFQILNGTFASLGEYPHMAALGYRHKEPNQQGYNFMCGGSLISDRYILTAAHCADKINSDPIIARLGTLNIKNPEENPVEYGEALDVNIESITLHPDYRTNRFTHDVALVRLAEVVPFNKNLHPACLYSDLSDNFPDTKLFITGWGTVDPTIDARSDFLLQANLSSVNLNECNNTYAANRIFSPNKLRAFNSGHFCAQDPRGFSDACYGDSGGPIQIIDSSPVGQSMPIIVGISSFGLSCGSPLPAVYARVAFYLDWIESIVWPN